MRQAGHEAGCGGGGLTRPAVNWAAWCGQDLLLEVRLPSLAAVLPVRLRHAPRMDMGALREWAPDGCELRSAWEWVPDTTGGEAVLHPLRQYYDQQQQKLSAIEVDRSVALRFGGPPGPSEGRRLPAGGAGAEAARLEGLAGCLVRLALHPPGVAITGVVSRPFRIERVVCTGTGLGLYGPGPVRLELRGVQVQRVRDSGDAGWLVDVWHDEHGYTLSFHVYGGHAGTSLCGQGRPGRSRQAGGPGGAERHEGELNGRHAGDTPPGQPVATPEAAVVQMRLPLW